MRPTISVIIPTFKRKARLFALIDDLRSGTVVPDEIVVVDNDPVADVSLADGCASRGAKYIHLGGGLFLSGARNAGWRATTGDLCIFIDDDNSLPNTFVESFATAAMRYPDLGLILTPVIFEASEHPNVLCGGVRRSMWTTRTYLLYRGQAATPDLAMWPTDDAPNAFAARRNVLEAVDGFDQDRFPFHYDEADITARIKAAGFSAGTVANIVIRHHVMRGGVGKEFTRAYELGGRKRIELMVRARIFFHRRHSRGLQRLVALAVFVPIYAGVVAGACLMDPAPFDLRMRTIGGYPIRVDRRLL